MDKHAVEDAEEDDSADDVGRRYSQQADGQHRAHRQPDGAEGDAGVAGGPYQWHYQQGDDGGAGALQESGETGLPVQFVPEREDDGQQDHRRQQDAGKGGGSSFPAVQTVAEATPEVYAENAGHGVDNGQGVVKFFVAHSARHGRDAPAQRFDGGISVPGTQKTAEQESLEEAQIGIHETRENAVV